jgi:hypothetical protein
MKLPASYNKVQLIRYGFAKGRWNPNKMRWEMLIEGGWVTLAKTSEHFAGRSYNKNASHYKSPAPRINAGILNDVC